MQKASNSKKNIAAALTIVFILFYGYIAAENKPSQDWQLPLYTSQLEYYPSLFLAIDRGDITPDKLIILSDDPSYFLYHFLHSRIYMTRWHPDLVPGEMIVSSRDIRRYYRSNEGWTYNRNTYPLLFNKCDILRLAREIKKPSDTWISFLSVQWENLDPSSRGLWEYLKENFPNDGTPVLAQTFLDAIDEGLSALESDN
jgi:hypothetical protein